MKDLKLYVIDGCPFCQRVLNHMEQQGIEGVDVLSVTKDADAKAELIEKGGKYQAPCLFIDGEPMYESADIIQWFEENK